MAAIDTVIAVRDQLAPLRDTADTRQQTRNAINNARTSLDGALTEAPRINIGRARNQLIEAVRLLQTGDAAAGRAKLVTAVHALELYIGGAR